MGRWDGAGRISWPGDSYPAGVAGRHGAPVAFSMFDEARRASDQIYILLQLQGRRREQVREEPAQEAAVVVVVGRVDAGSVG